MSNSPNSHTIREYFLDMYRAVSEYMDYQRDYQNMMVIVNQRNLLKYKDARIDELNLKMDKQSEEIAQLLGYSKDTSTKLTSVLSLVTTTKKDVVVPAENALLQEIVILMVSADECFFVVSCVQKRNRKVTIRENKNKHSDKDLTVLCEIESKPNAKNILHRFKDYIKTHGLYDQIKVSTTSSFILKETCSMKPDDIATLFNELSKTHEERVMNL